MTSMNGGFPKVTDPVLFGVHNYCFGNYECGDLFNITNGEDDSESQYAEWKVANRN